MGWGDCGFDSNGRPIGYVHEATCDEPGCKDKIDRGLYYACGGMHGEADFYCEKYFCSNHLNIIPIGSRFEQVCNACAKFLEDEE